MTTPATPAQNSSHITYGAQRRNGICAAAQRLGVTYGHLYKCLRWLHGDISPRARPPSPDLERNIRQLYPELLPREEAAKC